MIAFDAHANFIAVLVDTPPSPATTGTAVVVTAGGGALFPSVPFNVTVFPGDANPSSSNAEIVRVTGITSDTLTITREQESTSARTIVAGDRLVLTITSKTLTDIEDAIEDGLAVECPDNSISYKWVPRLSNDGETIVGEWQAV